MKLRIACLCFLASALPAVASQPYDGSWSMTAATQAGSCSTYSFEVGIMEGLIQTPPNVPVAGSGVVTSKGRVSVRFVAGSDVITASGQAATQMASGRWTAPTLGCSGSWNAQRR